MKGTRIIRYGAGWLALTAAVLAVWLLGGQQNRPTAMKPAPEASPQPASSQEEITEETAVAEEREEMAGVWVPYMVLATQEHSQQAFEDNFKAIADSAKKKGLNALFVHVRAFSDAFYPSELYPWSHLLTGEQGKDPGFDPLQFMVDYTHSLGMEFHAWINPLRIRTTETPQSLSQDNPYEALRADNPYYFMEWEGAVYLNPAYPYVRTLIAKGAAEIAEKYPVDGIHFDDYFYPTEEAALDAESYELYCQTTAQPIGLLEWRTANISAMVAEVYDRVKKASPDMVFGISPQGNLENDKKMGADIAAWCSQAGYVDYICPQLYYGFENPVLSYSQALEQWNALPKHQGLKLYAGLALYKAGNSQQGEDWMGGDVISRQIEEARSMQCSGVLLYSSAYLDHPQTEMEVQNAVETLARLEENE